MQQVFLSQSKIDLAHYYAMKQDAEFGKRFLELLDESGYGNEPLRVIAKLCGVAIPTVRDYTLGNKIPAMDRARHIAEKFNCCVEYLLTGKGPKRPVEKQLNNPAELAHMIHENSALYEAFIHELIRLDTDLLTLHDVPEKHKPTLKTAVHALEKQEDGGDLAQCA